MAGDALEQKVADDRLKQLDVNYDGKAVFEPATIVIVSVAVVAAVSLITWTVVDKPSGDVFAHVLGETLKIVAEIGLPSAAAAAL